MQTSYTAQTLLNELTGQGVLIHPTDSGNLFLDGEMTDQQFAAVKELKPQILELFDSKVYRFASNEYLLIDLDLAFRVFDVSNKAANLFFTALLKHGEKCEREKSEMIIFNQPSLTAYKSELNLCAALETNGNLQTAFNEFVTTHSAGVPLGNWMQSKDAPLWQVRIFDGEKEIDFAVCNSIQSAILTGYYSAKNPDVKHEITRA